MSDFKLPLRQKILLGVTIAGGCLLAFYDQFNVLRLNELQYAFIMYGLGICFWIIMTENLIDLNNKRIYNIWIIIGLIQFAVYYLTKDNTDYNIYRPLKPSHDPFLASITSTAITAPLKSLLIVLIFYKIFDSIIKKLTGNFLINTYYQMSWKHDVVNRRITWLDVLFNILLIFIAIVAALIK